MGRRTSRDRNGHPDSQLAPGFMQMLDAWLNAT
jgi:hypothetical protein